jgi:hypothetical protein
MLLINSQQLSKSQELLSRNTAARQQPGEILQDTKQQDLWKTLCTKSTVFWDVTPYSLVEKFIDV